ncbi:MAG: phosphopantetheine-binding protein [Pseudomonadales bacterium]
MTKQDLLEILLSAVKEVSSVNEAFLSTLNPDTDIYFVDLGVNSIDYAEIVTIIMEQLNVDLPLDDFAKTNSIRDVVDLLFLKITDTQNM